MRHARAFLMATATPAKLSTKDVAEAFCTYTREELGYEVGIRMSIEHIDCRKWGSSESCPPICSCNVVALSRNHQIQRLFPTTTAEIIMHGFITDSVTLKEFIPSIYLVNSRDRVTSWPPISARTLEGLMAGLKKAVDNATGRDTKGAARQPSDQPQMIEVLQKILEVCNRIDRKT
jgi:hypothetical protein